MDAAATAADIIGFEHRKVCDALAGRHTEIGVVCRHARIHVFGRAAFCGTKLDKQALQYCL
jgi:hypothetical protein